MRLSFPELPSGYFAKNQPTQPKMEFYNCHTHLFTLDHVPKKFLPKPLTWLLKRKPMRKIMRGVIPFSRRDLMDRYVNFFEVTLLGSQEKVLQKLKGYYPQGQVAQTKFIVLPMDMKYMEAGDVPVELDQQHEDLSKLVENGEPIIPFIGTDPRRPKLASFVEKWHKKGFKGLKMYPPLGFYPTHPVLMDEVYPYAVKHKIPIMVHCSRGGVYIKKVSKEMLEEPNPLNRKVVKAKPKIFSDIYTDPANYGPVLEKHPKLCVCLAHFGGGDEWEKYLKTSWDPSKPEMERSWLSVIIDLIKKYENVYADISSTLFHGEENRVDLLKILLVDKKIRQRVLFGSDYYMMERVKDLERINSIRLRSLLGEELFHQIAITNVERYLNGSNTN